MDFQAEIDLLRSRVRELEERFESLYDWVKQEDPEPDDEPNVSFEEGEDLVG